MSVLITIGTTLAWLAFSYVLAMVVVLLVKAGNGL